MCCASAGLALVAAGFMLVGSYDGKATQGQISHTPHAHRPGLDAQNVEYGPQNEIEGFSNANDNPNITQTGPANEKFSNTSDNLNIPQTGPANEGFSNISENLNISQNGLANIGFSETALSTWSVVEVYE